MGVTQRLVRMSYNFAALVVSLLSKFFNRIRININETAVNGFSFVLTLVFQQRKYFPIYFLVFRYFGVWFGPF